LFALPMRARILLVCLAALSAALVAACGTPKKTSTHTAAASAKTCTPASMQTHTKGVLTVATDSPAYPPYFEHNDPSNGQGFESAVAYAVADKLGYKRSNVKWVVEPFDASYAPGPKSFDFDINEISITKARAKAVDFSPGYYTNPQAIIVASKSSLAHAKSLAALKGANIGVQIGTTSLSATQSQIKPTHAPQVFNTSNDVVQAFKIHRVNAIVVDLATAFELTSTELPHTTIAGQFSAPGGDQWGLLMAKGSPIAACVDRAVNELQANGTLAKLDKRWIASGSNVPVLR
jgi:polar amino acid transport system substrate-binding protein